VRETPLLYSIAMPSTVHATVTAEGEQTLLDAYRERLNAALAAEAGVGLKELHTPGRLEYRLAAKGGLPFPALVDASFDVPELSLRVVWEDAEQGISGAALIEAGALKDQSNAQTDARAGHHGGAEVRADADGTIVLAIACRRRGDEWIGYALTAGEHAFFRVRPGVALEATDGVDLEWAERWTLGADDAGAYVELDPREPLDAALAADLGKVADAFAEEWVWFEADAPLETAIERARFAAYGYAVREANLRSAKLRSAMRRDGDAYTFSSLDAVAKDVAALVARYWLQTERH
jgi:hypothetical protein